MSSWPEKLRAGGAAFVDAWKTPGGRARLDRRLAKLVPWILLIFAVIYYGNYFRAGLNLGGEGGTTAVLAMRLLEGQRPIVDTFLGYNLLWFYPVAGLFKLTGPNYLVLQLYFFVLCTLAALLGYAVVKRSTGAAWFGLLVMIPLVLIPGPIFRNYQAFLANLNLFVLIAAFVVESKTPWHRWRWYAVAGISIGVTLLTRIELGLFFIVIWLGLLLLHPFGRLRHTGRYAAEGVGAFAVGGLLILLLQFGMYLHADARGFGREFLGQYPAAVDHMAYQLRTHFTEPAAAIPATSGSLLPIARSLEPARPLPDPLLAVADGTLERSSFDQFFDPETPLGDRAMVLLTYAPVLFTFLILVGGGLALAQAIVAGDPVGRRHALVPLVSLGSALTLFPQFFFFRPDTPHLAEFLSPFIVCLACTGWIFTGWAWKRGQAPLAAALLFNVGALLVVILHFISSFPKESSGSVAADHKRGYEFRGENGTHVRLTSWELEEVQGIYDVIMRYSQPEDWVVALPYSPTVNLMTDRRSYLHNLYIDNATAPPHWRDETIAEFEKYRPAVVLIDNRDINGTEESRFRNWAFPVYRYLLDHYVYVGTYDWSDLFVHPDNYRDAAP